MESLADAIDAKDNYTKGHSGRVAAYSKEIAKRYGYDDKSQEKIFMMGLLHDVGKIGVPDEVINKPGRLTDEEFAKIKKHPGIGGKILGNIKEMPELAAGAKWHHERYDGKGYPEGLKGDDIPEEARIIAVADAFDAMTSNRSYRDAIPIEIVKGEIEKGRGSQFDPKFADIMIGLIDEGFLLS
ncbi:MAG: HD-GYP domain-containing protein [Pseudobutyrivibrio sp.]|nr:HD-GYP domain-containing protein [Pseudobutyrivibrio sp.]